MTKQKETKIKKSVLINAMGKYSSVIFQLIFSVVLSRILTPAEFGVVFFELFSDLGIGTAIVQNKELDDHDIQGIFSFTCLLGVGLSLIFSLFSFLIANFYNNKVYINLGMLFSVSILLTSINVVPNAILMRDKKFISVSIRTVISCVVGYAVAIALAFKGFSYYALVIRTIITVAFLLVWNLVFSKGVFRFTNDLKSIKKIWNYSAFQFGASFLNYFQRNLDSILVGKYMGEEIQGYYNKSYTLMQYPVSYLSQVITPVLHPILSDYQNQKNIIFKQYIKVLQLLLIIGVLVAGLFISCAEEIIYVMFGSQWSLAVEPLRIISFSIVPQMVTGTIGCIMQSMGDTKGLFKICCVTIVISGLGILAGIGTRTLTGLAYCIVVIYWLHLMVGAGELLRRGMGTVMKNEHMLLWPEILMLAVMYVASWLVYQFISIDNLFISLVVKGVAVVIVYEILLCTTGRYRILKDVLGGNTWRNHYCKDILMKKFF